MRAGYMLPTLHPYELNEQLAEAAVAAGYESLWLPDHLLGTYPPELWKQVSLSALMPDPDAWLDPFCTAAMLSRRFDVPLGTSVTDSVRRRAIDIARTALTLHHANRRGFIIGVGTGEKESTVPFGYDFDSPVARLESFLVELRALLTTGAMPTGPGRTGLPLRTEAGPPQIWIAAHGPRMLRLAGLYGDGWLPLGLSPRQYGTALGTVREAAAAAHRPTPTASLVLITMFSSSRGRLVEEINSAPLSKMLMLFASADVWRQYGLQHPAGPDCRGFVDVVPHDLEPDLIHRALADVPIEMFEKFVTLGNADEVASRIGEWQTNGLEHVVIADYSGVSGPVERATEHLPELHRLPGLLASVG